VTGETPGRDRAALLGRLATGETQVVTNCAVLTEGFDEPLVGCAVLARGCSNKSLLIQMAGRALRTVDAAKHPGVVKSDAIIIDFGRSLARHGDLLAGTRLDDGRIAEAPTKKCPDCAAELPVAVMACPLCGYRFPKKEEEVPAADQEDPIRRARLIEVDLLNRSPFAWENMGDEGLVAVGFHAQAAVKLMGTVWVAVGLEKGQRAVPLRVGLRHQALAAADDFLRTHEDGAAAHKSAHWLALCRRPSGRSSCSPRPGCRRPT
jgi:DNA repair protein RadD